MVSKDVDRAIDRFLSASSRIRKGLILQRSRIMQAADEAPKLFEGKPYQVTDLSGTHENDLDYYVYESVGLTTWPKRWPSPSVTQPRSRRLCRLRRRRPGVQEDHSQPSHAPVRRRLPGRPCLGSMSAAIRFEDDGKRDVPGRPEVPAPRCSPRTAERHRGVPPRATAGSVWPKTHPSRSTSRLHGRNAEARITAESQPGAGT